ncbi:unnamed protein product [Spirodela intermedia]|uniref:Uncharacterized protein n=1 Tax=Spirodela intermedia TaxID=51605 RepID=A0A7I8JCQ3_SPIIN|nr:unnamed protein product [Spirodela intermedia]CAA6667956.1 unnamed protein product [Spirodela intermedia]
MGYRRPPESPAREGAVGSLTWVTGGGAPSQLVSFAARRRVPSRTDRTFLGERTRKQEERETESDSLPPPLLGEGPYDFRAMLYYAQIEIGTPSKSYYVQWTRGVTSCGELHPLDLTLYDPKSSDSGYVVTCDQEFCTSTYGEEQACRPQQLCMYSILYGDGSGTNGYFVTDNLHYNQVTGDHQSGQVNASITFGCGAQQFGDLGSSSGALDGILGFGQSNSSMISQLASAGNVNGGGIFSIGQVVQPKVNTTPLIPNQPHYNINMKGIDVGGEFLKIPPTSLIVDDGFPIVTLHFENSLSLRVYPHDYLFQSRVNVWCIGWQNSGVQSRDGKDTTILGDLVLSNKLVFYDLEKQVIGWTEYNCSSSIKVQDHNTGEVYTINGRNISSACTLAMGRFILLFAIIAMICCLIF